MSLIVARAPYRISFFGGGTDYPDWYREEGGQVLSTSIDKYCYVTCRYFPRFFPAQHRIVWSSIEVVASIFDIRHPAVREALVMLGYDDSRGVELHHYGDLPARSGMGSSSAFAVALIMALTALKGRAMDVEKLYQSATTLEQDRLGENVGSQDQIAVSCGGMNHICFGPGDDINILPFSMAPERKQELNNNLMLFFLGRKRFASDIAAEVISNFRRKKSELRQIHAHVSEALRILGNDGDMDDFGRLLDETWELKRSLGKSVTSAAIDDAYAQACRAGALGGKLLGAGGGGFMLLYVPEDAQPAVRKSLIQFFEAPFRFTETGVTTYGDGTEALAGGV